MEDTMEKVRFSTFENTHGASQFGVHAQCLLYCRHSINVYCSLLRVRERFKI